MSGNQKGKGAAAAPAVAEIVPPPKKETWPEFLERVGNRVARAFVEWLAHSVLLFGIMAVIQGLHWSLINVLHVPANKDFFGKVTLQQLVDGADFALLVGIGIVGVVAAIRSYLGKT